MLTRKDFMGNHEWCFYGWQEGAAHQFFGPNNATDLWHVKKVNPQSMVHLTEKPVELAVRAMQYSSRAGENVLDLFGGSGSTLIAAEQTGRKAFLMELDPLYCDVIVQRWEKFTGGRPSGSRPAKSNQTNQSHRLGRERRRWPRERDVCAVSRPGAGLGVVGQPWRPVADTGQRGRRRGPTDGLEPKAHDDRETPKWGLVGDDVASVRATR